MSDWVDNVLSVSGAEEQIADVRKHILTKDGKFTFEILMPTPDSVRGTVGEKWWRNFHWGADGPENTKLTCLHPKYLHIEFQSANCPPEKFVNAMREKWPDVEIDAGVNYNEFEPY